MPKNNDFADAPTGLLDGVRRRISPRIVRAIASSDVCVDANKVAIQIILRPGPFPSPIGLAPGEAFSITRWWEPETHGEHEIGVLSLREGHLARLFACTCLLMDFPLRTSEWAKPVDLLPRLIESTMAVEHEWLAELDELIAWVQSACDRFGNGPYSNEFDASTHCLLARILIAVARGDPASPGSFCGAVEELCRRKRASRNESEQIASWMTEYSLSEHIWKRLGVTILTKPPTGWNDIDVTAVRKLEACIRLDMEVG